MNILQKLRYMGQQYSVGAYSRGGSNQKHYLLEAADLIDQLQAEKSELLAVIERLKTVVPQKLENVGDCPIHESYVDGWNNCIEEILQASPQPSQEKGNE